MFNSCKSISLLSFAYRTNQLKTIQFPIIKMYKIFTYSSWTVLHHCCNLTFLIIKHFPWWLSSFTTYFLNIWCHIKFLDKVHAILTSCHSWLSVKISVCQYYVFVTFINISCPRQWHFTELIMPLLIIPFKSLPSGILFYCYLDSYWMKTGF